MVYLTEINQVYSCIKIKGIKKKIAVKLNRISRSDRKNIRVTVSAKRDGWFTTLDRSVVFDDMLMYGYVVRKCPEGGTRATSQGAR